MAEQQRSEWWDLPSISELEGRPPTVRAALARSRALADRDPCAPRCTALQEHDRPPGVLPSTWLKLPAIPAHVQRLFASIRQQGAGHSSPTQSAQQEQARPPAPAPQGSAGQQPHPAPKAAAAAAAAGSNSPEATEAAGDGKPPARRPRGRPRKLQGAAAAGSEGEAAPQRAGTPTVGSAGSAAAELPRQQARKRGRPPSGQAAPEGGTGKQKPVSPAKALDKRMRQLKHKAAAGPTAGTAAGKAQPSLDTARQAQPEPHTQQPEQQPQQPQQPQQQQPQRPPPQPPQEQAQLVTAPGIEEQNFDALCDVLFEAQRQAAAAAAAAPAPPQPPSLPAAARAAPQQPPGTLPQAGAPGRARSLVPEEAAINLQAWDSAELADTGEAAAPGAAAAGAAADAPEPENEWAAFAGPALRRRIAEAAAEAQRAAPGGGQQQQLAQQQQPPPPAVLARAPLVQHDHAPLPAASAPVPAAGPGPGPSAVALLAAPGRAGPAPPAQPTAPPAPPPVIPLPQPRRRLPTQPAAVPPGGAAPGSSPSAAAPAGVGVNGGEDADVDDAELASFASAATRQLRMSQGKKHREKVCRCFPWFMPPPL